MPTLYSISDARQRAKQRLPRLIFDFIDGAAGNEEAKARNEAAFSSFLLQPRVLVKTDTRDVSTRLLDRTWNYPFGIAPMGMCNLAWPRADHMLAAAAKQHNIPLAISTMASTSIEIMSTLAAQNAWFQLYVSQSEQQAFSLVDRCLAAGYKTLIFTVDVPQVAPRLRDLRNGFQVPFKMGIRQFIDFATHPNWSIRSLLAGAPSLANVSTIKGSQPIDRNASRGFVDWDFLKRLRDHWPHTLIVKGILHPDDAVNVQSVGADAIYVSNHGGRQLNSAPPAIWQLPKIRQAVGETYPILFDSGIRSGEDIIKALAFGADFVMLGRPFLYGIAARQARGLNNIINLLANDVSVAMAQLGVTSIAQIDRSVLCDQHYFAKETQL